MGKIGQFSAEYVTPFVTGIAIVSVFSASFEAYDAWERRQEYPDGFVCEVGLAPGHSPGDLADRSSFAIDYETVIERSQFMNPDAVLLAAAGDDEHFSQEAIYNVMVPEDTDRPTNRPYFESDYAGDSQGSTCEINNEATDVVMTFPDDKAAANILGSTVAVIESEPSEQGVIPFRRCGYIATTNGLVALNEDWVADDFDCDRVRSAQAGDSVYDITADVDNGAFRHLGTDRPLPVTTEFADEYMPEVGDVLVYSGYDAGGRRDYFRVTVAGEKDGYLLLRSNIDQILIGDYADENNSIDTGTGALFTPEGGLVALMSNAMSLQEVSYGESIDEEYHQYQIDHNDWLRETTEEYGWNIEYQGTEEDQYIFALRVFSDDLILDREADD